MREAVKMLCHSRVRSVIRILVAKLNSGRAKEKLVLPPDVDLEFVSSLYVGHVDRRFKANGAHFRMLEVRVRFISSSSAAGLSERKGLLLREALPYNEALAREKADFLRRIRTNLA